MILSIDLVQEFLISKSRGIESRYLSEFSSLIIPRIITSARCPATYPLEADELAVLLSEPIIKYVVKFSNEVSATVYLINCCMVSSSTISIDSSSFTSFFST